MKLTAERRHALMARLATAAGMAPVVLMPMLPPPPQQPAGPKGVDPNLVMMQGVLGPSCPIPTPCVLIKNMFSAAEESGENWDIEIGEDVKEECSKYGPVVHVHVDKNSQVRSDYHVYGRLAAGKGALLTISFVLRSGFILYFVTSKVAILGASLRHVCITQRAMAQTVQFS